MFLPLEARDFWEKLPHWTDSCSKGQFQDKDRNPISFRWAKTNHRGKKTWVLNYWQDITSGLYCLIRWERILQANATGWMVLEEVPTLSRKINLFAALSFCFSISPTSKGYPNTLLAFICNLKVTTEARAPRAEKPEHCIEGWPPLATAREGPCAAGKTQHSQKNK